MMEPRKYLRNAAIACVFGLLGACSGGSAELDAIVDLDAAFEDIQSQDSVVDLVPGDVDVVDQDVGTDVVVPRFPACDITAKTQAISFVHVNDLHSSYMLSPDDSRESSYSRIAGYVKAVRTENPYTIFTNGGDDHEKGSIAEQLSRGYSTLEAVRALNFDVRVIGNHDFAWGADELLDFTHDDSATVLCSNTTYSGVDTEAWGAVTYAEIEVGCVKVGFFGLHPNPYNELNESYEGPYYLGNDEFVTRYDYENVIREIVDAHRAEVDLLVMVSHLGIGTDREMAGLVEGIDLILGAHSHSVTAEEELVGDTIIVQGGADSIFIGRLDVDFDLETRKVDGHEFELVLNMAGNLPADAETQAAIENIFASYAPGADQGAAVIKGGERSVAEVTAKAAIDFGGADAAAIWLETIWTSWAKGDLTPQNMLDIFKCERQPSGTSSWNSMYIVTVSGSDLRAISALNSPDLYYEGPVEIDDAREYRLAVQKGPAFNPDRFFGEDVVFGEPDFRAESWYVLYRYGATRKLQCIFMDCDEPIPGCSNPD